MNREQNNPDNQTTRPLIIHPPHPWRRTGMYLMALLIGLFLGAALATTTIRTQMQRIRTQPEFLRAKITGQTRKKLDLTEAQAIQVAEIIQRRQTRITELRKHMRRELSAEFDAMCQEVSTILDTGQVQKWQAFTEMIRQRHLSGIDPGTNRVPDPGVGENEG